MCWSFYPQLWLATICGYLLFPAGYPLHWFLVVICCWHEDSLREVAEMLLEETNTDLLSQSGLQVGLRHITKKSF